MLTIAELLMIIVMIMIKVNVGKKRKAKEIQIEKVRGNKQHIKSVETNANLNIIYELLTCDNTIRIDTA